MPRHRRQISNLGLLVLIALAFAFLFRPDSLYSRDFYKGDGTAYMSNAFSLGLDWDLDFSNEIAASQCLNPSHTPCGPPGPGILAAPFVFAFSWLDRLQGLEVLAERSRYHYSWSHFGFLFSTCLYFLLGVLLYCRAVARTFASVSCRLNLLFAAANLVAYYVLVRFAMGHAFEFFALALVVWGVCALYAPGRGGDSWLGPAAAGLGVCLLLIVRLGYYNVVLLPFAVLALLALARPNDGRSPGPAGWLRLAATTATGLAAAAAVYQVWFSTVFPLVPDVFGLPNPDHLTGGGLIGRALSSFVHLPGIVFSAEFGALYTAPLLVVGTVPALVLAARRLRQAPRPGLAALVLLLAYMGYSLLLAQMRYTGGSSYAFRYLLPIYPAALLGWAAWESRAWGLEGWGRRLAVGLRAALWGLCVLALLSQAFFRTSPELNVRPAVNLWGHFHDNAAPDYVTNLLPALASPEAWLRVAANHLPGYAAGMVMIWAGMGEKARSVGLPYQDLVGLPLRVHLQIALIAFFCVLGGWWVALRGGRRPGRDGPPGLPEENRP